MRGRVVAGLLVAGCRIAVPTPEPMPPASEGTARVVLLYEKSKPPNGMQVIEGETLLAWIMPGQWTVVDLPAGPHRLQTVDEAMTTHAWVGEFEAHKTYRARIVRIGSAWMVNPVIWPHAVVGWEPIEATPDAIAEFDAELAPARRMQITEDHPAWIQRIGRRVARIASRTEHVHEIRVSPEHAGP